jgi:ribosomal protein L11 methyltransferase
LRRSKASSANLVAARRRDSARRGLSIAVRPARSAYIEVIITLSPIAADLVSTLLFESGATAIAVTEGARSRLHTHLLDDPTLEANLERVRSYLASLRSLGFDPGPAKLITRRFEDRGWATRWKEFFRPTRIGRRLVVRPSWERTPVKEGEIVVELDPGMAFGTGQHPTTRMCLELLEEAFQRFRVHSSGFRAGRAESKTMNYERRTMNRPPAVLDLGTGSGLLAIAAFRFGAGTVLALDTDRVVCRIASENIRRNGGDGRIVVKHGSLEMVGRRTFDMVLANLTAERLINCAPSLTRSLRSRGRLIASGILRNQEQGVAATFRGCGMVLERVRRSRDWVGLMFRRPAASPRGLS